MSGARDVVPLTSRALDADDGSMLGLRVMLTFRSAIVLNVKHEDGGTADFALIFAPPSADSSVPVQFGDVELALALRYAGVAPLFH